MADGKKRRSIQMHGMSKSPEYNAWKQMKVRCRSRSAKRWAGYGERGIRVCPRWENSFLTFLADMGPRPSNTSLDRYPDNSGDYEPGNCRWATQEEQQNNKRSNRLIAFNGETLTLTQWARQGGIRAETLRQRLDEWSWPLERALLTPANKPPLISSRMVAQWNRELGLSVLGRRLTSGWPLDRAVEHVLVAPVPSRPLPLLHGKTIADFARETGVKYATIAGRLRRDWAVERACHEAAAQKRPRIIAGKNLSQWSRVIGVPVSTIQRRLALGWPADRALTEKSRPMKRKSPLPASLPESRSRTA